MTCHDVKCLLKRDWHDLTVAETAAMSKHCFGCPRCMEMLDEGYDECVRNSTEEEVAVIRELGVQRALRIVMDPEAREVIR